MSYSLPKKNGKSYYQTPTYNCWSNMLSRTRNKKHPGYKNYGGRGITVCNDWLKFENFLNDMGEKPRNLSIDRVNNDGNYNKKNCRWATQKEQCQNQRKNIIIIYNGRKYIANDLVKVLGVSHSTIVRRAMNNGSLTERIIYKRKIDVSSFLFTDNRNDDIKKLRNLGTTMAQIGDIFNISRQRVKQILDNEL